LHSSWLDYAGSPEKIMMDNLESDIAFASICMTDTTYPYSCDEYHTIVAKNYDLSISPNIQGFKDYQRTHTEIRYREV
jgi:hypothetical protein